MSYAVAAETVKEQRFMQWVKAYSDAILRTCFVYLSNVQDAEDAMQDTFLKAWKAMDTFEERTKNIRKVCRYLYDNRSFYRPALKIEGQNSLSDHFKEFFYSPSQ